jgi:hypothetical protein
MEIGEFCNTILMMWQKGGADTKRAEPFLALPIRGCVIGS